MRQHFKGADPIAQDERLDCRVDKTNIRRLENRYLLDLVPTMKSLFIVLAFSMLCATGDDLDAQEKNLDMGWVSSLRYTPNTGIIYSLENAKDNKNIPVLLGVKSKDRKITIKGQNRNINITSIEKKNDIYKYKYKDLYSGITEIHRENTWQFTVTRKILAHQELQFKWWENYLNSHLIIGRPFLDTRNSIPVTISKNVLAAGSTSNTLGKNRSFTEMTFDSAIGKINLQFSIPAKLIDHRNTPWRTHDNAHLIFKKFIVKKGESLQLDMQVKITPDFDKLEKYLPIASRKDIYTPKKPLPPHRIIAPTPKQVTWQEGHFNLGIKANLFHRLRNENIGRRAREFFADMFQIDLQEQRLDSRWENTLVLTNEKFLPAFDQSLEQLHEKAAMLKPEDSYVLRISENAILIVGKNETGVWNGLMTLFQMSRRQISVDSITYEQVDIADYPDFKYRGTYIHFESNTDLTWQRNFVEAISELKYNRVLLYFGTGAGVRFHSHPGSYDSEKNSISVEEFAEFIRYAKSLNLEIIPIWSAGKTMFRRSYIEKHFNKFPDIEALTIKEGINWDISLHQAFIYNKRILDEIIELTGAKTIHIGLDEIHNFALHSREKTGQGAIILADYINKFTDEYAPRGIRTVIYQDMLVNRKSVKNSGEHFPSNAQGGSEKALDLLRNRDMLSIDNWSYGENTVYPDFDHLLSKGFHVYGSSWYRYENIIGLSAYTKGRSDTFVGTHWASARNSRKRAWDIRGSRSLKSKLPTYKFLPSMGLVGEAAWNAGKRNIPYNFLEETLRLFNQRKGRIPNKKNIRVVDLSAQVNRDLADTHSSNGAGFIEQGKTMDLSSFPSRRQVFGGVPFLIAENQKKQPRAISVKGAYSTQLPLKIRIPLQKGKYSSLIFLHTCHFNFEAYNNKDLKIYYTLTYEDGTSQKIKLVNDRNIMAWAPALTRFDPANTDLWLAWTGMTEDNLPISIYGYTWQNPQPEKIIDSIHLQANPKTNASVFLLALTGIK